MIQKKLGGIRMIDQAGIRMAQGESIAGERISGVNDNMMKSHYHNYYELYYLEDGERYHMMEDDLYIMHAGEMILFSPYIMHRSYGENDVPFKRIVLYFQREDVNSEELLRALDENNGMYCPDPAVRQKLHRILEELIREFENPTEFYREYRKTLLNMFLFTMLMQTQRMKPEEKKNADRIRVIINYIHQHYQEDITLQSLSSRFYISPSYLCREFKKHTNSTIVQYTNVTRVMNAQRKLMETDKNITQISQETGFSNLTHFNRIFKSVTGLTPSGYRKNHQNLIGGYLD